MVTHTTLSHSHTHIQSLLTNIHKSYLLHTQKMIQYIITGQTHAHTYRPWNLEIVIQSHHYQERLTEKTVKYKGKQMQNAMIHKFK